MSTEFQWFQCQLLMSDNTLRRGTRGIAKSEGEFKKRINKQSEEIFREKKIPAKYALKNIIVEVVPDEIKNKYNLNNIDDYNKFLDYLD
jgi:hypothetical protein